MSILRDFVKEVFEAHQANPRAVTITISRKSAVYAARRIGKTLQASARGGRNARGKSGRKITKPDDPKAKADRGRQRLHRTIKRGE